MSRRPWSRCSPLGNPEERSGLGFAVMQSFMDRVKVTSRPGKGTKVVLIKRLSARAST